MLRIGTVLMTLILAALPAAWAGESPAAAGSPGAPSAGLTGGADAASLMRPALAATACPAAAAASGFTAAQPVALAAGCFKCYASGLIGGPFTGPTDTAIDSTCANATADLTRALEAAAQTFCGKRADAYCMLTITITSPCSGSGTISVSGFATYHCGLNLC